MKTLTESQKISIQDQFVKEFIGKLKQEFKNFNPIGVSILFLSDDNEFMQSSHIFNMKIMPKYEMYKTELLKGLE